LALAFFRVAFAAASYLPLEDKLIFSPLLLLLLSSFLVFLLPTPSHLTNVPARNAIPEVLLGYKKPIGSGLHGLIV